MSKQAPFDTDTAHRWFGVEYNNAIFPLLEKAERTQEETERMIAMAYASLLHWSSYTKHTAANRARGEYMISTANSYAGRKEAALHHARRCYEITYISKNEMADFDFSYANMACARALALNGETDEAKKFYDACMKSAKEVKDAEDKKIVLSDMDSGPWYGLK